MARVTWIVGGRGRDPPAVGRLHGQFQRIEHAARIAVGDVDQVVQRVGIHR